MHCLAFGAWIAVPQQAGCCAAGIARLASLSFRGMRTAGRCVYIFTSWSGRERIEDTSPPICSVGLRLGCGIAASLATSLGEKKLPRERLGLDSELELQESTSEKKRNMGP